MIRMNIKKVSILLLSSACMIVLILDSRTAIQGAIRGIDICMKSLIPSLFPFFIFSSLLTSSLTGKAIRILHPFNKICRIPRGSESLLLIGFLGGYPVGSQNVMHARETGYLSQEDACRMIVFCNNAGPAFIFGLLGQFFHHAVFPWILWSIHIISAILTGFLIPGGTLKQTRIRCSAQISIPYALDSSIRVMARVCGWVVLFRIFLEFIRKWIFWQLPVSVQILITGLLELSNGCLLLQNLPSDGFRLIFASSFLGFGGLCVLLQTHSIVRDIPFSFYLPGKLLQSTIGFLLAYGAQFFLEADGRVHISPYILGLILLIAVVSVLLLHKFKKPLAFSDKLLYNEESSEKRRTICCFAKKSNVPAPTASTVPN